MTKIKISVGELCKTNELTKAIYDFDFVNQNDRNKMDENRRTK
jgi:hypothetical protein